MVNKTEVLVVIIIVCLGIAGFCWIYFGFTRLYEIRGAVKAKMLSPADSGTTYVVVLWDNTKLEVKRNWWYWSSEYNEDGIYANIAVNKTYLFTCWGISFDFAGWYYYPNIIKAVEVAVNG